MAVTINPQSRDVDHTDVDMTTAMSELRKHGNEVFEVTDERGRVIKLKRPNAIAKLRFVKALGKESTNQLYVGMVTPLMYVVSIGGIEAPSVYDVREVEALYQRLDEDGIEAVTKGIFDHMQALDEVDTELAKK